MDIVSIHRSRGNRASVHLLCHVAGEVWRCLQHTSRAAAAGGSGFRAYSPPEVDGILRRAESSSHRHVCASRWANPPPP